MSLPPFDPEAPLPDAPDPWQPSAMPAWRDGPPYAMTEMIAAEPALAGRVVARLQADPTVAEAASTVRATAQDRGPITTTGCGTSHHAALGLAALLADGLSRAGLPDHRVAAIQAFELSRRFSAGGVAVAVSHEGGTEATNEALRMARVAGATTVLVTVSARSPGAALADHVLTTGEQDQSWCHTVGYLSPLLAGVCLHAALGGTALDPEVVARQVVAGSDGAAAERAVDRLSTANRLLVVGSGADYVAARELALKIEEGARLPATAHELETIRHGHLAAADDRTGLVVFLTNGEGRGSDLTDRVRSVLRAAAALEMPVHLIGAADAEISTGERAGASWQAVALDERLPRPVAAILASATPLQLLTERLARRRGVNPDTLAREDPAHARAGDA